MAMYRLQFAGVAPQVIQEVFCWTRLPMEVRRLAARKEDLFRELLGDTVPPVPPGAGALLQLLVKNKVRRGAAQTDPRAASEDGLWPGPC